MQILTLIKMQLKLLFRNRLAILATLAVPIILTYLFSFSSEHTSNEKLYIADLDKSSYSKQFIRALAAHKDLTVISASEADIRQKVDNQQIPLGLIVEKNFSESLDSDETAHLKLLQNYENSETILLEHLIAGELGTLKRIAADSQYLSCQLGVDRAHLSSDLSDSVSASQNITVEGAAAESSDTLQKNTFLKLMGFLVMFIWFVMVQGFRTLIDERDTHLFSRLLSTPVSYSLHLTTKAAAAYILGAFHIIGVLAAGKYFLKLGSISNLLGIGLILSVYLFLLTSLTLLFALFIKKQQNFTLVSAIIITITGLIGGSFFSMDVAPKHMQIISKLTPEAWTLDALNALVMRNASVSSQLMPLVFFTVLGIVAFSVSGIWVRLRTHTTYSI